MKGKLYYGRTTSSRGRTVYMIQGMKYDLVKSLKIHSIYMIYIAI